MLRTNLQILTDTISAMKEIAQLLLGRGGAVPPQGES